MSDQKLGIQIDVAIDGEIVATRNACDFGDAEEQLGKLERWFAKEQALAENRTEEIEDNN